MRAWQKANSPLPTFSGITKKIGNRFTKRVFACPQCSQKLRVPIRAGKILEVNCKSCSARFQLSFKIPLIEVFKWQSGKSLKHNLFDIKKRFWSLSYRSKLEVVFFALSIAILILYIFSPELLSKQNLPLVEPAEFSESPVVRQP